MGQPTKLYAAFCASYWMKKLPKHRIQSRKKSNLPLKAFSQANNSGATPSSLNQKAHYLEVACFINAPVGQSTEKRHMSKPKLLRDVIVVVAAKVVLLIAAGVFVFGPANRPNIDSASVESRLIESGPPSPSRSSTP
jgi:hypothetical protein